MGVPGVRGDRKEDCWKSPPWKVTEDHLCSGPWGSLIKVGTTPALKGPGLFFLSSTFLEGLECRDQTPASWGREGALPWRTSHAVSAPACYTSAGPLNRGSSVFSWGCWRVLAFPNLMPTLVKAVYCHGRAVMPVWSWLSALDQ